MSANTPARVLAPPLRAYKGHVTNPARWALWTPRRGDILVCTPAKCGTTWTQTIVANLLYAGAPPAPVSEISPWIDATFATSDVTRAALDAQTGRRVVKTHTPGDGFPVWEGVHVVAVYRHPLDVFLSLRKHIMNMWDRPDDHPLKQPVDQALDTFLTRSFHEDDADSDSLALVAAHHARTVTQARHPGLTVLHYADMIADHRGTVAHLARALDIPADAGLIDRVTELTRFGAMKARASQLVPEAGQKIWKDETAFFAQGGTGNWQGTISPEGVARYRARLAEVMPDPVTRAWLESGARTATDN